MLQRILILYIAGILLCDFLLGDGPWRDREWQRQDAAVSTGYAYADSLRHSCERLLTDARLDTTTVALAQGVLLGDKHLMGKEQKQVMRDAGMSHLLAVSGLHIGIIWALLSFLLRPLVLISDRGWHRWIILLLLWGYIAVLGFPTSAVRAGVMISMIQISWFLERDVWGWHNLCSAALLILVVEPHQLYEIGFQLSFLATAGILAAGPWLQEECPRVRSPYTGRDEASWMMRLYWRCRQLFLLTVSAQCLTFPLVAYYFHHVPLFGWVQGFLVVPVMALFICLSVALLFLSLLGIPTGAIAWIVDLLSQWMGCVARYTGSLEQFCLGGRLQWYPALWQVLLLLAALVFIAWILVQYKKTNIKKSNNEVL